MSPSLSGTGMVVTMDIGDPADIHPRDKQTVGRRLALKALQTRYGERVQADGPRLRSVASEDGALRLPFDGCEGGLAADGAPATFEVAGADGGFVA